MNRLMGTIQILVNAHDGNAEEELHQRSNIVSSDKY